MDNLKSAYKILDEVYRKKAYSKIALNDASAEPLTRRIVLGVLERDFELEHIIKQLALKKPQYAVNLVLKIGIYCLLYVDSMPDYAAVNEAVKLAKNVGKGGVSGFVNAVLKKVQAKEYSLDGIEVEYNKPAWLIERVFAEYVKDDAERILKSDGGDGKVHVRPNLRVYTAGELEEELKESGTQYTKTEADGFLVCLNDFVKDMFANGLVTYQSPSSMLAVKAMGLFEGAKVLDVCAAPGGKGVYASELAGDLGKVVACDIHPHRIDLIRSYAKRMKATNVECLLQDSAVKNESFVEQFDFVLCDVPCSGLGTVGKKADIAINKKPEDIAELAKLQKQILSTAAEYVKKGGVLVYSTCTVLDEENGAVVRGFLEKCKSFKLENMDLSFENKGSVQILPDADAGWDGFYIAKLRKEG